MTKREKIARRLFEEGAVLIDIKEGFQLKLHEANPSAPRSPIKFNIRPPRVKNGNVSAQLYQEIGAELVRLVMNTAPTTRILVGVPSAGDVLVDAMCAYSRAQDDIPDFARVTLAKSEGLNQRRVNGLLDYQGHFPGGDKNVTGLIDDLITEAGSKIESLDVLRAATFTVPFCFVVIDREQGGAENINKLGVQLKSLYTLRWLIGFYQQEKLISDSEHAAIVAYLEQKK